MRILVSGGGTGGHVYPLLSVLAELQSQRAGDLETLYVGRADSIEERLTKHAGIPFQRIKAGGVRGLAPWTAAWNLVSLIASTRSVQVCMRSFRPAAVVVTGGYVSAPVVWAASAEHVPSVIYLPDLEPGWAIRVTSLWATHVAVSFDEVQFRSAQGKRVVTGYPVRPGFIHVDRIQAREKFGLDADLPTVTILGGSRGARSINRAVAVNLEALAKMAQIIHISGTEDEVWANSQVQALPSQLRSRARVFGYIDDRLPEAFAAANVVVARAGAATLGEFPILAVPSILVPYPYAGRHQEKNARYLVERGAAARVDNADLERELVPTLKALLESPDRLDKMSRAAAKLARPDAAGNLADLVRSLAGEEV